MLQLIFIIQDRNSNFLRLLFIILSAASISHAECYLDINIYDPNGNKLNYQIDDVYLHKENIRKSILHKDIDGIKAESKNNRLFINDSNIVGGIDLEVRLLNKITNDKINRIVNFNSCNGLVSFFSDHESSVDSADVFGLRVHGKLIGCKFDNSWWIKIISLFNDPAGNSFEEGAISISGQFDFLIPPSGRRKMIIIGQGKRPIKAFSTNATVPMDINLGTINLSNLCSD